MGSINSSLSENPEDLNLKDSGTKLQLITCGSEYLRTHNPDVWSSGQALEAQSKTCLANFSQTLLNITTCFKIKVTQGPFVKIRIANGCLSRVRESGKAAMTTQETTCPSPWGEKKKQRLPGQGSSGTPTNDRNKLWQQMNRHCCAWWCPPLIPALRTQNLRRIRKEFKTPASLECWGPALNKIQPEKRYFCDFFFPQMALGNHRKALLGMCPSHDGPAFSTYFLMCEHVLIWNQRS